MLRVVICKLGHYDPHTPVDGLGLGWWLRMMATHTIISLMRKKRQMVVVAYRLRIRVAKVVIRRTSMLLVVWMVSSEVWARSG